MTRTFGDMVSGYTAAAARLDHECQALARLAATMQADLHATPTRGGRVGETLAKVRAGRERDRVLDVVADRMLPDVLAADDLGADMWDETVSDAERARVIGGGR